MGTPERQRPEVVGEPVELVHELFDYGTREAWFAARVQGIGASESAALFGVSPWHNRVSLWANKTGKVAAVDGPPAEYIEWGNLLEVPIATRYEQKTGRTLWQGGGQYAVVQHPRIPCMRATPDRWVIEAPAGWGPDGSHPNAPGLLQIKNTNVFKASDWDAGPPDFIQIQVQHEMACTGRLWASVAVLIGGCEFQSFDIPRNPAFIAELEYQCQLFWDLVQSGEQPPLDNSERTLETIKKLHPCDNGMEVILPEQALDWWAQLEAAKEQCKVAVASKTEAEARLKDAIGDATYGVLPNGRRLSLKTSQNPGHNTPVGPYSYRTLRMEAEWTPKKRRHR